jgi:hypothetical protein
MGLLLLRTVENELMRFSTTMFQIGNNTGIEVPADVLEALDAGKRPPVAPRVVDVPEDLRTGRLTGRGGGLGEAGGLSGYLGVWSRQ